MELRVELVGQVEHRTYSGAGARRRGQPALYITARCVFRLGDEGLELIEVLTKAKETAQ